MHCIRFIQNLLNVLVQIANKMGLQKRSLVMKREPCTAIFSDLEGSTPELTSEEAMIRFQTNSSTR
jgi:hypothetical protein